MSVKYLKGSLFDAPEGSLLVHACNTQGVWGSGIAKEFKKRFPIAFEQYNALCISHPTMRTIDLQDLRGHFQLISSGESHTVGCLYTSGGYGAKVDDVDTILIHTVLSVEKALMSARKAFYWTDGQMNTIYSNKFNSGLFGVPWEYTENVINTLLLRYPMIEWIVYTGE